MVSAAVLDSAVAATAEQRRLAGAEDGEILKFLNKAMWNRRAGIAERQRFADAVRPLIEAQRARFGTRCSGTWRRSAHLRNKTGP